MTHTSIPTGAPIELINVTSLNPFISKCQIKVCYVGNEPNRNGSVITKNTALDLANSLPGSPIVGYYDMKSEDFQEHNRMINTANWEVNDTTRPYGFVDLNAKVWFQKFFDDGVEHEYLVTEGYLWTGQYPETQRIIDKGNNQSMELDENSMQGFWATNDNQDAMFFIINEAIISKLCILGEDYEPCFEGAQIAKEFSLDESFNQKIFKLMQEVKKLKGEDTPMDNEEKTLDKVLNPEEEVITEFAAQETEVVDEAAAEEQSVEEPAEPIAEFELAAEEPEADPEVEEQPEESAEEEEPESEENLEDSSAQFSLEDFQDLTERYSALQNEMEELKNSFAALNEQLTALNEENAALKEFKLEVERSQKQAMIDSFYMLSEADKKDVQDNIDNYSIDDIEAKLSIICVRNKLDLSGREENSIKDTTYNLDHEDNEDDNIPDWIKVLRDTKNNDR